MIQEKVILNDIVYKLNPDGKSYSLEECRYRGATINIAGVIDGLSVNKVKAYAFSNKSLLESIYFPSSIMEIPQGAFENCSKLNYISFYGNKIGHKAFSGCTSLRRISFLDVNYISSEAFYNCTNLKDIFVPSLREIGDDAFARCFSLVEVNLPQSVTKIGAGAFSACPKISVFTIPQGVNTIRQYTFSGCENLADIRLHEGITTIEAFAFRGCKSLRSVELPRSLTKIGENIFSECNNLTSWGNNTIYSNDGKVLVKCPKDIKSLDIPDGVTQIADGAFEQCGNLTEITIPNGVKTIGERAFCDCRALKTVKLPSSIVSIGKNAFWNCPNVSRIDISDLKSWCDITFGSKNTPAFYYDLKLYINGVQLIDLVIPDSVKQINDYAFRNCYSLRSIKVGSRVKHIGKSAFEKCINLESFTTGPEVECIGEKAFNECTNLTSVTITENVKTVGESAFKDCDKLSYVSTPSISAWCKISFADMHANPLMYSKALYVNDEIVKHLVIPNDVDLISDYALLNCQSLKEITISSTLKKIGESAFRWCNNLEKVFISDIKSWCTISFNEGSFNPLLCHAKKLYLNNQIVKDLVLPDDVDSINAYAFFGYSDLKSVTIGTNVKSIGRHAFGRCNCLNIYCEQPEKPEKWDNDWFYRDSVNGYNTAVYWGVSFYEDSFENDNPAKSHSKDSAIEQNVTSNSTIISESDYGSTATCSSSVSHNDSDLLFVLNDNKQSYAIARASKRIKGEFVIPSSHKGLPVTKILADAFVECDKLTGVTIPASITQIEPYYWYPDQKGSYIRPVFDGCVKLKNIYIEEGNQAYKSINGDLYSKANGGIYSQTIDTLVRFSIGKTDPIFILPSNVKVAEPTAFTDANNIKEIQLHKDFLGTYTFSNANNIEAINVDKKNRRFYSCDGIYSCDGNLFGTFKFKKFLSFYKKTTYFMFYARAKVNASFAIPKTVTSIAREAFTKCYNLKSVTIHKNVQKVDDYAFVNCPNLTIYCEADSKPEGWRDDWAIDVKEVIWGAKKN